jgi:hypothetical protein
LSPYRGMEKAGLSPSERMRGRPSTNERTVPAHRPAGIPGVLLFQLELRPLLALAFDVVITSGVEGLWGGDPVPIRQILRESIAAGADRHLGKPLSAEALLTLVGELLQ